MGDKPSVRESIGLDAASEGDPKGVRIFLSWLNQELNMLAYVTPEMPKPVSERIAQFEKETDRLMHFLDGFIAANGEQER